MTTAPYSRQQSPPFEAPFALPGLDRQATASLLLAAGLLLFILLPTLACARPAHVSPGELVQAQARAQERRLRAADRVRVAARSMRARLSLFNPLPRLD